MTQRRALAALVAAGALALSACLVDPTEVMVVVGTDLPPSIPLTVSVSVSRELHDASGAAPQRTFVRADGGVQFPATFAIVPTPGEPHDDTVDLLVAGTAPGLRALHTRARFQFVPAHTVLVRVFLSGACQYPAPATECTAIGVPGCTLEDVCDARGMACGVNGTCVPIDAPGMVVHGLDGAPGFDATPFMACGAENAPCCPGNACNAALSCIAGICSCGSVGAPCCGGTRCAMGAICQTGGCVSCGAAGQPCCAGNACDAGASCMAGQCVGCGAAGEPCCAGSACDAVTLCVAGRCAPCGGNGERCCAGGACGGGLVCNGTCVPCGGRGQPCCGGGACDASLGCMGGTCTCGVAGTPCCGGSNCSSGTECRAGNCVNCTGIAGSCAAGQLCCSPTRCGSTTLGTVCCGDLGVPCSASNQCCGSLFCCNHGGSVGFVCTTPGTLPGC